MEGRPPLTGSAGLSPFAGPPRVAGAPRKWRLIEQAGPMEQLGTSARSERRDALRDTRRGASPTGIRTLTPRLWVQRVGLSISAARALVADTTLHGNIPEPLRVAHLIAGGITTGKSRGRA